VLIETIPAALHEQRLDRVVALIADISRWGESLSTVLLEFLAR
jgi:hypothetical protein